MERSRGTDISWLHGTTSAPSPSPPSTLPPHRGLPADVVYRHRYVLYHVEALASHSDGPATAEGTARLVRLPTARTVRQSGCGWVWISPDRAAAWPDGSDDWVLHVPEGKVPMHAAPALKAHTHRH